MAKLILISIFNSGVVGVQKKVTSLYDHLDQLTSGDVDYIMIKCDPQNYTLNASVGATIINEKITSGNKNIYEAMSIHIHKYYGDKVPLIFFRYPFANSSLLKFVSQFGNRIIFEHNTKEVAELLMYFKYYGIRYFLYNLKRFNFSDLAGKFALLISEIIYGSIILKKVVGGICVTPEIALYESSRSVNKSYAIGIIGNSFNRTKGGSVKTLLPLTDSLECVFIAGHSNNWHGIDRVLKGMANYKGLYQIHLHYIGDVFHEAKKLLNDLGLGNCVILHGVCDAEQIEEVISKCHLGISSLGLHRIPLKDGSVLKTREYLGFGLPVLFSYYDDEIEKNYILSNFVIKYKANDDAIDFSEVILSLKKVQKSNISPKEIRKVMEEHFNSTAKAKQLMEVVNSYI
jgi:hypothetical protein